MTIGELPQQLLTRFNALTLRERLVVLFAGVIVSSVCWYALLGERTFAQRERLGSETAEIQKRLDGLQSVALQLELPGADDDAESKTRLRQLQQRTAAVQDMIDDYTAELISPTEMARLLEMVLDRQSALRLRRLGNLGAQDLLADDEPGQQRLYRHRFAMELEGPFLACLAYLEDLEDLPWRLYWQVLEIDADDYPNNRILIEVATLSLHEEWIGV